MKVKKEYYQLKAKMKEINRYFRVTDTPDFASYNEACDFYRDHCDKGYYKMDIYEDISVHKCFEVEDEFVLHLKNNPKTEFKPRPFNSQTEGYTKWAEEVKQTIANSRESTEAAKNKMESTPRAL
tara:strand:+ start:255 stop:629 length:375 start_codon:yes stop_codon:yes gene_type:complete